MDIDISKMNLKQKFLHTLFSIDLKGIRNELFPGKEQRKRKDIFVNIFFMKIFSRKEGHVRSVKTHRFYEKNNFYVDKIIEKQQKKNKILAFDRSLFNKIMFNDPKYLYGMRLLFYGYGSPTEKKESA